jgi:DNA-binding MarR family transcriptional regulator
VETTINNPEHFYLRKTLNSDNWRALRRVGKQINARFLEALGEGSSGLPDADTLASVVLPTVHDGQRAPGLRFGEPRVMALLASIASFEHVTTGLTNRSLREHMTELYTPGYTSPQATYDLRRLRLKGFIERVPGTHTYRITARGRAVATFFTRLAARVIVPVLTDLGDTPRPSRRMPRPLVAAWRAYDRELRKVTKELQAAA